MAHTTTRLLFDHGRARAAAPSGASWFSNAHPGPALAASADMTDA